MSRELAYTGCYEDFDEQQRYDLACILTAGAKQCGDDPAHWNHAMQMLDEAMTLLLSHETRENYANYIATIGRYFLEDGDFVEAVSYLQQALKYSDEPEIAQNLGASHANLDNVLDALWFWEVALRKLSGNRTIDRDIMCDIARNVRIVYRALNVRREIIYEKNCVRAAISHLFAVLQAVDQLSEK